MCLTLLCLGLRAAAEAERQDQLEEQEHARKGVLTCNLKRPETGYGLNVCPAQNSGCIVGHVFEGGPAHQAGIRPGWRILTVNGKNVVNASSTLIIQEFHANPNEVWLQVGDAVALAYYRKTGRIPMGQQVTVTAR